MTPLIWRFRSILVAFSEYINFTMSLHWKKDNIFFGQNWAILFIVLHFAPIRTVYINNAPLSRDFLRDWFKFELKIVSWLYWHITFKVAIVFFMCLKFHFSIVSKFAAFSVPNVFKSCWNQFVKQTFLEAMKGQKSCVIFV